MYLMQSARAATQTRRNSNRGTPGGSSVSRFLCRSPRHDGQQERAYLVSSLDQGRRPMFYHFIAPKRCNWCTLSPITAYGIPERHALYVCIRSLGTFVQRALHNRSVRVRFGCCAVSLHPCIASGARSLPPLQSCCDIPNRHTLAAYALVVLMSSPCRPTSSMF